MIRAATPGGLRERKKQQTRARIVGVALDLCETQGFEHTTVEQIAAAADVSARTVNRYFETKEDIVLAPIEDVLRTATDLLRAQPATGDELRALRDSYLALLDGIATTGEPVTFERFQQVHRVLRDTPAVGARSREFGDRKSAAMAAVLADRLGTEPCDLRVRLTIATWQAVLHVAMDEWDRCAPSATPPSAQGCRQSVIEAFDVYARTCGPAMQEALPTS